MVIKIEGTPDTLFDLTSERLNNFETALKSYRKTYDIDKKGITLPNANDLLHDLTDKISSFFKSSTKKPPPNQIIKKPYDISQQTTSN